MGLVPPEVPIDLLQSRSNDGDEDRGTFCNSQHCCEQRDSRRKRALSPSAPCGTCDAVIAVVQCECATTCLFTVKVALLGGHRA